MEEAKIDEAVQAMEEVKIDEAVRSEEAKGDGAVQALI